MGLFSKDIARHLLRGKTDREGVAGDDREGPTTPISNKGFKATCARGSWFRAGQSTPCASTKSLNASGSASLLQETLEEEKAADKKLTAVAETKVNRRAA